MKIQVEEWFYLMHCLDTAKIVRKIIYFQICKINNKTLAEKNIVCLTYVGLIFTFLKLLVCLALFSFYAIESKVLLSVIDLPYHLACCPENNYLSNFCMEEFCIFLSVYCSAQMSIPLSDIPDWHHCFQCVIMFKDTTTCATIGFTFGHFSIDFRKYTSFHVPKL